MNAFNLINPKQIDCIWGESAQYSLTLPELSVLSLIICSSW